MSYCAAGKMDSLKPVKQHILWKNKAEMLQSRVDELQEENDLLRKQLEERSAREQGMDKYSRWTSRTCVGFKRILPVP